MERIGTGRNGALPEKGFPAPMAAAEADVYGSHALEPADLDLVQPVSVMLEQDDIRPYLENVPAGRGIGGWRNALLCVAAPLAALAVAWFGDWSLFRSYAPPPVQELAAPGQYLSGIPEAHREAVQAINSHIAEKRWDSAANRLEALLAALAGESGRDAESLREWALTELLVAGASPPLAAFPKAEAWYGELGELAKANGDGHPSYRAMEAYLRIVDNNGSPRDAAALMAVLSAMRAEYGATMDASRYALGVEAARHLAAMPTWRRTEPDLSNHWRAASHAIDILGKLTGEQGEEYAALQYRKWEKLAECFWWGLDGDDAVVEVAGVSYAKKQVESQKRKYKRELERLRDGM